jgi:FKBP-type peptidyl-prolyl cis-trans isomerase 2
MKVGDRKIVELPADKAFGERNPEFVRLIPLSIFKENGVDPIPGRYVTINNVSGRVVSVDGGRVKIDFNHPLAGKKVEYELEIKGEIKDTDEKVRAIVSYYTGVNQDDIEILVKEKEVEIKFKKAIGVPQARKEMIAKTITKWINDLEVVKFVDIYTK